MSRDNPKEIDCMVSILIRKGKEVAPLVLVESREGNEKPVYYLKTQPRLGPNNATQVRCSFYIKILSTRICIHIKDFAFVYFICPEKLSNCYAKHYFLIS